MENKKSSKSYLIGVAVLVVVIILVIVLLGTPKSGGKKNEPANPVGNWVSAVSGKGMEGSGKIKIGSTTADITVGGDINLTIDKVENGVASGTVTYNNLCYTSTRTTAGKVTVGKPQCVSGVSKTIELAITGDKMTFGAQTVLGVDLKYEASFTNDAIKGTFSRAGTNDKINENISGTFSLVRAKK